MLLLTACSNITQLNKNGGHSPSKPSINSPNENSKHTRQEAHKYAEQHSSKYICNTAYTFAGRIVGDGHCVSLIKQCSSAPVTRQWRAGKRVMSYKSGSIKPGSIIATFKFGRYPNQSGYHAAIYISHDKNGIWVWDQWLGKPVHQRLIRALRNGATASNSAHAYRLVK